MNDLCKELKGRAEIALNTDDDIDLYHLLIKAVTQIEKYSRQSNENSWRLENQRRELQDRDEYGWR